MTKIILQKNTRKIKESKKKTEKYFKMPSNQNENRKKMKNYNTYIFVINVEERDD